MSTLTPFPFLFPVPISMGVAGGTTPAVEAGLNFGDLIGVDGGVGNAIGTDSTAVISPARGDISPVRGDGLATTSDVDVRLAERMAFEPAAPEAAVPTETGEAVAVAGKAQPGATYAEATNAEVAPELAPQVATVAAPLSPVPESSVPVPVPVPAAPDSLSPALLAPEFSGSASLESAPSASDDPEAIATETDAPDLLPPASDIPGREVSAADSGAVISDETSSPSISPLVSLPTPPAAVATDGDRLAAGPAELAGSRPSPADESATVASSDDPSSTTTTASDDDGTVDSDVDGGRDSADGDRTDSVSLDASTVAGMGMVPDPLVVAALTAPQPGSGTGTVETDGPLAEDGAVISPAASRPPVARPVFRPSANAPSAGDMMPAAPGVEGLPAESDGATSDLAASGSSEEAFTPAQAVTPDTILADDIIADDAMAMGNARPTLAVADDAAPVDDLAAADVEANARAAATAFDRMDDAMVGTPRPEAVETAQDEGVSAPPSPSVSEVGTFEPDADGTAPSEAARPTTVPVAPVSGADGADARVAVLQSAEAAAPRLPEIDARTAHRPVASEGEAIATADPTLPEGDESTPVATVVVAAEEDSEPLAPVASASRPAEAAAEASSAAMAVGRAFPGGAVSGDEVAVTVVAEPPAVADGAPIAVNTSPEPVTEAPIGTLATADAAISSGAALPPLGASAEALADDGRMALPTSTASPRNVDLAPDSRMADVKTATAPVVAGADAALSASKGTVSSGSADASVALHEAPDAAPVQGGSTGTASTGTTSARATSLQASPAPSAPLPPAPVPDGAYAASLAASEAATSLDSNGLTPSTPVRASAMPVQGATPDGMSVQTARAVTGVSEAARAFVDRLRAGRSSPAQTTAPVATASTTTASGSTASSATALGATASIATTSGHADTTTATAGAADSAGTTASVTAATTVAAGTPAASAVSASAMAPLSTGIVAAPVAATAAAVAQQNSTGTAQDDLGDAVRLAGAARAIARQVGHGGKRFSIRLDPADLGKVDVSVDFSADGSARAQLTVERHEAYAYLSRDQRHIEQALRDAGFSAGNGSVSVSLRQDDGGAQAEARDRRQQGGEGTVRSAPQQGDEDTPATASVPSGGYGQRRRGLVDLRI